MVLLGVEIFIAERMHDAIIRPYGGDYLCVILLYCLIRSFWRLPPLPLALAVLIFAYCVEVSQYFHLADRLGFSKPSFIRMLMGYGFSWWDMVCYSLGIGTVLIVERLTNKNGTLRTS
jgi:hypothetical protein